MKTLVLSVVFAVTSIVNAVNNNSLEGFAYNTRMDGDRVETKNVYKVKEDKYLQNHLQYNYAYDAEGRVSSKEVSKWSKGNQRFEKQYCLNFSYDGGEVNVEYAAWNRKDNAYTDVKTKAVYQINGMGVNYQSYEWNKKESFFYFCLFKKEIISICYLYEEEGITKTVDCRFPGGFTCGSISP